jgi:hypothetical protein
LTRFSLSFIDRPIDIVSTTATTTTKKKKKKKKLMFQYFLAASTCGPMQHNSEV